MIGTLLAVSVPPVQTLQLQYSVLVVLTSTLSVVSAPGTPEGLPCKTSQGPVFKSAHCSHGFSFECLEMIMKPNLYTKSYCCRENSTTTQQRQCESPTKTTTTLQRHNSTTVFTTYSYLVFELNGRNTTPRQHQETRVVGALSSPMLCTTVPGIFFVCLEKGSLYRQCQS